MHAQKAEPAWLCLERGKQAFDAKDFGTALVFFDEAVTARASRFALAADKLAKVLETRAAKQSAGSIRALLTAFAGDDFIQREYLQLLAGRNPAERGALEAVRKERISDSHRVFIDALLAVYEYRPAAFIGDSIPKLSETVKALCDYPEAEYWKGRVFFIEGESGLAETQYKRAYAMRASLEIPDDQYTILYAMAAVYQARPDHTAWENVMRRIADEVDAGIDTFLREAMVKTLLDSGFDRFMTLYRFDPSYALKANTALAQFYLDRGRARALELAAISVNMTLTGALRNLIPVHSVRKGEYVWTNLETFLQDAAKDTAAENFFADSDIYRKLFILADALYIAGARPAASGLWSAIATYSQAPYKAAAESRLKAPSSAVRVQAP